MEDKFLTKKNIVKILLILFLATIFFLWLANLKNVFKNDSKTMDNTWKSINNDLDKTLKQIEDDFANQTKTENKEFVTDLLTKTASTADINLEKKATTTIKEEIREDLENIIKASTTVNAVTASSTKNCPPYINCMPSIGESRPCVIPVGCEGITQIAY